ncbi:MAG: LytR/AlgR family response regulator transcription factor [Candidatus Coproplasma sp.]
MIIVAADDEPLMLARLARSIKECCPQAQVESFLKPSELLEWIENNTPDCAFLDIRMRGMSGVEIATEIKKRYPSVNVIFVTGYGEYAADAMNMHASGYVMKPVTREKIEKELADLRYPVNSLSALINIKCFGNFEAFSKDGERLVFERSKAKELFAYLVYKNGAFCSIREISATLFEEDGDEKKRQSYIRVLIHDITSVLKKVGAEEVVSKIYGGISVNPKLIDCDWYRFNAGDASAINVYAGEFMSQYSWAESVNGYLDGVINSKKGF